MKASSIFPMLAVLILCCASVSCTQKKVPPQRQAVLEVLSRFFTAMTARDSLATDKLLLPDGQFYAVRETGGRTAVNLRTHREYLQGLTQGTDIYRERIWDATVHVHDRIAVVWTPYDFHINGKFSHCGIDAFTLIKTPSGWKIAGAVYTVEPQGCEKSPHGDHEEDKLNE